MIYKLKINTH